MVTTECSTGLRSRRRRPSLHSGLALVGALGLSGTLLTPACTPDDEKPYAERANLEGGKPDPGCVDQCRYQKRGEPQPPLVDCEAAEDGLEFYPLAIWDFDTGLSSNLFTYTDPTSVFLDPNGWEAPTEVSPRCESGDPSNQALHIRGGPFINWGGGMGRDMKCLNWSPRLGRIKYDQLGKGPEWYSHYGNPDEFDNVPCTTSAECARGLVCTETSPGNSTCQRPPCTSQADCPEPDWFCNLERATPRCDAFTTDRACGESPRWILPETGREFGGDVEGACAGGIDPSQIESEEERQLYIQYRELIASACPALDQQAIAEDDPAVAGSEEYLLGMTLDFSEWEGISFWARRSPDSQAGVRLALGDKYIDEDVTYLQNHINPADEAHCRRMKECWLAPDEPEKCINGRPCTAVVMPDSGQASGTPQDCDSQAIDENGNCEIAQYCFDPETDIWPVGWNCTETDGKWQCTGGQPNVDHPRCSDDCAAEGLANCVAPENCPEGHPCSTYDFGDPDVEGDEVRYCWNAIRDAVPEDPEFEFPECGDYACNFLYRPFQKLDANFHGQTCQDFPLVGGITRAFCYDEESGPLPPEGLEQCGDLWLSPVYLNETWEFYKVPFDELLQQGWAKEAHRFDLTSLAVLRFMWDRGWVDYWIDDVRIYRHKKE